jgi:hypothetical protein
MCLGDHVRKRLRPIDYCPPKIVDRAVRIIDKDFGGLFKIQQLERGSSPTGKGLGDCSVAEPIYLPNLDQ